jgi:general secretion pathway protein A
MVLTYYQLAEQPFGVTPDPRFLFQSPTHREAMASVLYAMKAGRGFTALIADPGMGKTTVLFNLLQQLGESTRTAFLFQAQDSPKNFLRNLLGDLGIEDDGQDMVSMQKKLNECLVREISQGKNFVVVVDEAQNLDESVLEVVRMLSNFETASEKLMTIVLAGQPQLAEKLRSPQLTQLRQRVSIVARLKPFNSEETRAYIEHRLKVAGYRGATLFSDGAYALIAQHSEGIPRNINNICFNAMAIGCAMQLRSMDTAVIEEVLADLDLAPLSARAPVSEYQAPSGSRAQKLQAHASALSKGWGLRAGIAGLTMLLAGTGWMMLANHQRAVVASAPQVQPAPNESSQVQAQMQPAADRSVPQTRKVVIPNPGEKAKSSSSQPELISVGAQDTLYHICMSHLGRYDEQVVKLIRELNPQLENPRRLKIGQQLRLPSPASLASRRNLSANGTKNRPPGYAMLSSTSYVSQSNDSAVEAKKP